MKRKIRRFQRKFLRLPVIQRVILSFACVFACFFTALVITVYSAPKYQAKVAYIKAPRANLAYYVRGHGEPLILLPGFGMTMQHWDPNLIESLSQTNQVIVIDYRGVGFSSGSTEGINENQIAQDVITVMDGLQLDKAHIVGWSLGSFVAQDLAEQHPDRVDKLILISTAPGGNTAVPAPNKIKEAVDNNLGGNWENVFVQMMFVDPNKGKDYLTRLKNAQASKEVPTGAEETIQAKSAHELAFADDGMEKDRYTNLSKITSPTLIIGGEKDQFIPVANDTLVQHKIPNSQLYIVKGGGHASIFENTNEVVNEIKGFLRGR